MFVANSLCLHSLKMISLCSFLLQIDYDWVKDLLPRLHELDAYGLSGCLKPDDQSKEAAAMEDSKDTETSADRLQLKKGIESFYQVVTLKMQCCNE